MIKNCFCSNKNACNVFKPFAFVDSIADTVFELFTISEEVKTTSRRRTYLKVLKPAKTVYNTKIVQLSSATVMRRVVRKHAEIFNPWADQYEKITLHHAQNLGIKMFRVRRT